MIVRINGIGTTLRVPRGEIDTVLRALTELTVKLWLIQQGRFRDLQSYATACAVPLALLREHYEDEALAAGVYDIEVSNDDEHVSTDTEGEP